MFVLISENGIRNVQEASQKTWKLKKMLLILFQVPINMLAGQTFLSLSFPGVYTGKDVGK